MTKPTMPKKELHKHNSIPNYVDGLEDGCIACVKNATINAFTAYLKEVASEEAIYNILYEMRYENNSNYQLNQRAKAIHKQIMGE